MSMRDRFMYRGPLLDTEGVVVREFTVEENSLENLRLMFQPGGRHSKPGTYRQMIVDGVLWMSDTDAEFRDHLTPIHVADRFARGRGLVHGLGMGCLLGAWLDVLDHVDVVESDERICRLIGKWYEDEYPGKVTIHHADAYTWRAPKGSHWNVVWHDIWPSLSSDNLPEMATLHRRYGSRCDWQGSWGKELCQYERRRHGW